MSSERQWGTLELMGLTKKEDPTMKVGDGRVATVTESPKPPMPQAPTYASDPSRRSQNSLGAKDRKGGSKGKNSP